MAPASSRLQQGWPNAVVEVSEYPALAPNVHLTGELQGTGFTDRQWLVQRDGRFVQLTELLYRVAEHANGERTLDEIAERVTAATDWMVGPDHIRQIIQTKLIPLGLVATADGAGVPRIEERERSPLQVNMRRKIITPRSLDLIAKRLQVLYAPTILIPLMLAVIIAHGWLFFIHGIAEGMRAALYTPGGLVVVLPLALMAGLFHEFGHATALRYGGGQVRGMGVGFYLRYPTLYTDVTDGYPAGSVGQIAHRPRRYLLPSHLRACHHRPLLYLRI